MFNNRSTTRLHQCLTRWRSNIKCRFSFAALSINCFTSKAKSVAKIPNQWLGCEISSSEHSQTWQENLSPGKRTKGRDHITWSKLHHIMWSPVHHVPWFPVYHLIPSLSTYKPSIYEIKQTWKTCKYPITPRCRLPVKQPNGLDCSRDLCLYYLLLFLR